MMVFVLCLVSWSILALIRGRGLRRLQLQSLKHALVNSVHPRCHTPRAVSSEKEFDRLKSVLAIDMVLALISVSCLMEKKLETTI